MANEIKTVDELRGAYPALVDQIEQAAALRATNAERAAHPRHRGNGPARQRARSPTRPSTTKPMSASDYAKAAMKNAKEQGSGLAEHHAAGRKRRAA